MDGDKFCLGIRQLGRATAPNSSMGCRPLGATPRRMGLDRGPLAVIRRQIASRGWMGVAGIQRSYEPYAL